MKNLLVNLPITLKKIMSKITKNKLGIVFVVDKNNKLLGSISDGDIRRGMLKGLDIKDKISTKSKIIEKSPFSLNFDTSVQEIWKYLDKEYRGRLIKCIPLVDKSKKLIDISTPQRLRKFSVAQPSIGEHELSNIIDCVSSGWISSKGSYIGKFESEFSKYLGGGNVVSVSSGTTAIQLGLSALGIGEGDEVLVPNFTFAATINAIIHSKATPIIVDIDKNTWTISLQDIQRKITQKTRAIVPVHIYGQPYHIDEIINFSKKNNLYVIEDCAEAVGAKYKKRLVGLDGDCSCFSFFANKTITTGEGGAVIFKDKKIASKARILRDHGMSQSGSYKHEYVGYNFRMTNMQAAIGLAQLKRVNVFIKRRKNVFNYYNNNLNKNKRITFLPNNEWSENSYWSYTVKINNLGLQKRDKLLEQLKKRGIECRPAFYPLNLMNPYKIFGHEKYEVTQEISFNSISLPTSNDLSKTEVDYISSIFLDELKKIL